jgi:hypothetical protein
MSILRVLVKKYVVFQGREKKEKELEIYRYLKENGQAVAAYACNLGYKRGLKKPWMFVEDLVDGCKVD